MRAAVSIALVLALAAAGGANAEALHPFDANTWQAIRSGHAGRLTLVHFWGMTCGPCRVEMPKLGAFLAKHPEIAVVTVDTDQMVGAPGAAERFLTTSAMPLSDAWQFADPFAEKLYFSVDPAWQGEIPMTILIDRTGAVTEKIGALAPGEIDTWLSLQSTKP